jgi:LacI family transcriptional regulator
MAQRQRVGIITNDHSGVFQRLIIQGFGDIAAPQGFACEVRDVTHATAAQTLAEEAFSGVLVIANAVPDTVLIDLYAQGRPLSLVSHQVRQEPIPSVMFNSAQGIRLLFEYVVVNCQRSQLVFVGGIAGQSDAAQREAAFRQELLRYNISVPEDHFLCGDFWPEKAVAALRAFLDAGHTCDGIIAADYMMAAAVVRALRDWGISVPQQVSVVGFGDAPDAERAGVTTVAANVRELGQRAAYQLISQMKGLTMRGVTTLSVELVIRET